jgi:hypothetical protein
MHDQTDASDEMPRATLLVPKELFTARHLDIGADFVQRVTDLLAGDPRILSYGATETKWHANETAEFQASDLVKVGISITVTKP